MALPVLLLVLWGTAEFSIAFGRFQLIANAARTGAREASLYRSPCNPAEVRTRVEQAVQDAAGGLGMFPSDLRIRTTGLCATGNSRVEVTYRHRIIALPRVALGRPFIDLVSTSVMRNEL